MDPGQYFVFVLLFLLSGFFSGTEIALMSLPNHKIDTFLKQKKFGARILQKIKSNPDKLLITILVGNNLVNVYAAALATQISISIAESSGIEEGLAIGLATGAITFLILVFGEIVPKSFATKNSEKISLFVAYPYRVLMVLMFPVIFFLEFIIKIFTGKDVGTKVTEEEIETFIDLGKDSGTLEDDEHERLKNTLEFSDTLVEEIMVPRVKIEAIEDTMTIDEALAYYMSHTHSRIPVYHDQIDNIIGIVTIRDILREQSAGRGDILLGDLYFKKLVKVPINQPIDTLLETFKSSRQHMSIVMDEYGGVAGITTIEDIVEEIFGEIHDETDYETDEIVKKSKNIYVVDSSVRIDEVLADMGLTLSHIGLDDREFGGETVSYIITHALERFPEAGEELCYDIIDDMASEDGKIPELVLCFKVLDFEDATMGQVQIQRKNK